jgi:hypothetical protein
MDVIGHEAIRPDLDAASVAPLGDERHVEEVVVVAEEGLLSAVSTLRDVMRKIRDDGARETRHAPGIMEGSDIGIGTGLRMVSPWNIPIDPDVVSLPWNGEEPAIQSPSEP